MEKRFNVTGLCFPDQHYMGDVSKKLEQTIKMVEIGEYFIINRPRQYGKTTTLYTLCDILTAKGDYIVFNMSFEGIGNAMFENEATFGKGFTSLLGQMVEESAPDYVEWYDTESKSLLAGQRRLRCGLSSPLNLCFSSSSRSSSWPI